MTTPETNYRPATTADLETCADVLYTADDALSASRGLPVSPRNREALVRLYAHMQRHAPDRWWVAERDGRIIGFGGSSAYQEMVYLGFLFVLPDQQAGGVGRRLLELSMHDSTYRAVAIASYQPISAALYSWYGMTPRVPIYMLTGKPRTELPPLPAGLSVRPIKAADTQPLDMEVCGLTRVPDHEWWEELGRKRYGLFRGQRARWLRLRPGGRPSRTLSSCAARSTCCPSAAGSSRRCPMSTRGWSTSPARPTRRSCALLHAGMRLEGPPAIYCANEMRIDHSRYLPASYALP